MLLALVTLVFLIIINAPAESVCPICDQNDYKPVCAGGKAYGSLCKLKREICLGKTVDWKYGICKVLKEPPLMRRADKNDQRVVFRLFRRRFI